MTFTFHCRDTENLFNGKRVARFVQLETEVLCKLRQIHAAAALEFLKVPPGNCLEALEEDRPNPLQLAMARLFCLV